jgi:hypothetical protein
MLAMARSVPQASNSTKSGKWEKKKFMGNELRGKTLGVVGLGCIGQEVVKRARAFEMRVIASDPYVNPQTAKDLDVSLVGPQRVVCPQRLHHPSRGRDAGNHSHAVSRRLRQDEARCAHRQLRPRRTLIDEAALKAAIESARWPAPA